MPNTVLITGGGAHNTFLLNRLMELGQKKNILFEKPEHQIIDFKESLLMAYLGYLHVHNKRFGIFSQTGALHDSIGGALYKAVK